MCAQVEGPLAERTLSFKFIIWFLFFRSFWCAWWEFVFVLSPVFCSSPLSPLLWKPLMGVVTEDIADTPAAHHLQSARLFRLFFRLFLVDFFLDSLLWLLCNLLLDAYRKDTGEKNCLGVSERWDHGCILLVERNAVFSSSIHFVWFDHRRFSIFGLMSGVSLTLRDRRWRYCTCRCCLP